MARTTLAGFVGAIRTTNSLNKGAVQMKRELRYTDDDLSNIVRRALELEQDMGSLTATQVSEIARELGIRDDAVTAALNEYRGGSTPKPRFRLLRWLRVPAVMSVGWFTGWVVSNQFDWRQFNLPSVWSTLAISLVLGTLSSRSEKRRRFQFLNAALWLTYFATQIYLIWGMTEINSPFHFPTNFAWLVAKCWAGSSIAGLLLIAVSRAGRDGSNPSSEPLKARIRERLKKWIDIVFQRSRAHTVVQKL